MADKSTKNNISEPDEKFDYEELSEEEDYAEDFPDDPEDEDGEIVIRFKPWMIPAFIGMVILAILICIPLWKLSHHNNNNSNGGGGDTLPAVIVTEETETETAVEPEVTVTPEAVATSEPTPTATPEPTAEPTPATTPENRPVVVDTPASAPVSDGSMTFTDVSETVTAKDVSNLRSTPSTSDEGNVVGQLKNGETLTRTGRNDDTGWSRLNYNGQTVYAVSAYLTTDLSYTTPTAPVNSNRVSTQDGRVIVFVDCDDYITPKDLINLRTEPSTSEGESTVRTQVRNGTNLHRTGYSEASGWSRVEYNGEILYAVTNYVISGTAPE
mgnify:CR=1 FL=1